MPAVSFTDFREGRFSFDNNFSAMLHLRADDLNQVVAKVVQEEPLLRVLREDYSKLISKEEKGLFYE